MHSRRIVDFYAAFKRLDPAAMQAAYAPEARFSTPLFQLQGAEQIGAMWAMLCDAIDRRSLDQWRLEVGEIEATAQRGRARWQPHWRIRASGRVVQGATDAEFSFDKHGRILSHDERFSFWRWACAVPCWAGHRCGATTWAPGRASRCTTTCPRTGVPRSCCGPPPGTRSPPWADFVMLTLPPRRQG